MRHLIVVGFSGNRRASSLFRELLRTSYDGTFDLIDAVAVYRTDDGALRIEDSVQRTMKEGAGWGATIGALLGALVAGPFAPVVGIAGAAAIGLEILSSATVGAALGAKRADQSKHKHGIPDDFVIEVGEKIRPGHSAVVAVLESSDLDRLHAALREDADWILRTTLSPNVAPRGLDMLRE